MAAVYFDSGTTNTRIYVMDENFRVIASETRSIGSKDSAIRKSNHPLLWAMKKMYENALEICGLEDRDIEGIYISGMATSPYGIVEIPHREIPIKAEGLAKAIVPYYEEICFGRTIYLIPGLKTNASEFIYVNNVRGEETELIGALEELKKRNLRGGTAVIPTPMRPMWKRNGSAASCPIFPENCSTRSELRQSLRPY